MNTLKTYYFTIKIYRRAKLHQVIEIDSLSTLARIVIETEDLRQLKSPVYSVTIEKSFASIDNNYDELLENFGIDNNATFIRRALAIKGGKKWQ